MEIIIAAINRGRIEAIKECAEIINENGILGNIHHYKEINQSILNLIEQVK
jgi:hypothetical protein